MSSERFFFVRPVERWKWPLAEAATNGRHFADDIYEFDFLDENILISINISLKFIPKGTINNIPALVQIINGLEPTRQQAIIWINDG